MSEFALTQDPEVRRMCQAATTNELAAALLSASDFTIVKYSWAAYGAADRLGFSEGRKLIEARLRVSVAVRDDAGQLPRLVAHEAEALRQILARHAAEPEGDPDL